jgi:uncharacterized protein YbaP (TraB family)
MTSTIRTTLAALLLAATPVAAQAAPGMWQVSDADSKVWLFGSIHTLPPGIDWRTPVFDDALKQAETVYFEADIGPIGQMGIILKAIQMGMAARDPWLPKLTPEQSKKLSAAIGPLGLTLDGLGAQPPWLADATIEDKIMRQSGFDVTLGVDPSLQAELPKERKAYFETATGQMDMLGADPPDRQIARLMTTVDTIATLPGQLTQMTASWSAGDVDALAKLLIDDPAMDQSFAQTMLFNRNADWVTQIGQLLAGNHQDLIVVGAGHLAGNGSVLDLLEKAGFTVERIQ